MITLQKHKDNIQLCKLKSGKKSIPVWWHPTRKPELRLAVSDVGSFNNEIFRDKFKLSQNQAEEIIQHLKNNTTPENHLQTKHFAVKKFIENSLYTQMDLSDSPNQSLVIDFPDGAHSWGELALYAGASASGKTHACCSKILSNLNGPAENRRQFIILSNEWNKDKTLEALKSEKYRSYVTGVDISERSFEMSLHSTPEEFYAKEVAGLLEYAERGSVILIDDSQDSAISHIMRRKINKLLRTSRHDFLGLMFILHSIRSGIWSAQASSSCKYFVLFPRSQRGKCTMFLNREMGCSLNESRDYIAEFAQSCRAMHVRLFSPQALIGEKRLQLI
jgi:hypothetical protein